MSTVYNKLKEYLENTSEEQIRKDWESTEQYDSADSPSIGEFLKNHKL